MSIRDLQHRQRRFLIAVAGTALVFAMGLIGSGLSARKAATVTGYPLHEFRRLAAGEPGVASVLGRAGRTQEGT